jgi:two-component system sensor histidine kinase KdpD
MATNTHRAADRIRREARVVGLRGVQIPSLEAVERRRLQLWIVTAVLLVSVAAGAAMLSLWPNTPVRSVITPSVLRIAVVLVSVSFCAYAIEKEMHLRRLSRMLVDERVLTVALQNRLHEVSLLLDAGKAMNSVLELPAVLDSILRSAIELLDGRSGSIMLRDGDELVSACVQGNDAARGRHQRIGDGVAGEVASTRDPLLIAGDVDAMRFPGHESRAQIVDSAMSVPLEARGELLGILNVNADTERDFSEYDLRALSLFAEQAAGAIANANLYETEREHVAELMELDRMKSEFIALVSHELRTPITTILAASETAQRPGLEGKQGELVSMIERQTRRLAGMVEQLLTAARLENQLEVTELVPVDLATVARVAASDADVAGRRVSVEAPASAVVLGDADSLRRVVDNLIDNAFKYGVPPVEVAIEVAEGPLSDEAYRDGEVVLSVVDHGPGIAAVDRDRIFERFQRLEEGSEHAPGLGLGLSIARGVVAACDGRIVVEDAPGGGAAIRLAFPLRVPQREVV